MGSELGRGMGDVRVRILGWDEIGRAMDGECKEDRRNRVDE